MTKSELGKKIAAQDAAFKAMQKGKGGPSASFKAKSTRFEAAKTTAPFVDNQTGTVADAVEKAKRSKGSAWSRNSEPQRSPAKGTACDKYYDVESPAFPRQSKPSAWARSTSVRDEEIKLTMGQEHLGQDPTVSPSAAKVPVTAASMKSGSPRFEAINTKKFATTEFQMSQKNTISYAAGATTASKSSWAKDNIQRLKAKQAPTDLVYDTTPSVTGRAISARCAFSSTLDRFSPQRERAPDPGAYASPYISSGMQ
jgi:hypothetical protein